MEELKQIITLIEQIDTKLNKNSEQLADLQNQYNELDETYNRMHKIKLKKENELYKQITDLQDKIKQMEKDSMDAITFDVYEKDIETLTSQITELENTIKRKDKTIQELRQALSEHEQNKDIHKKPLDNTARLHSKQTRQDNAEKDRILILQTINSYIQLFYSKEISLYTNNQISLDQLQKTLKVDMSKIMAHTKKSDKTIRKTVSLYSKGNIKANIPFVDEWLRFNNNKQLFKNTL